ncbi:anoctamin-10 [Pundamilia nyererei]|uniref:Anoctamin n=1 Tax=Pundamilia nyererei TaxID=303518 RepID=A0A9Y6MB36_9CICH|nr:PREDICTED: anoctamin-10-like [Pundamilia nyererei]
MCYSCRMIFVCSLMSHSLIMSKAGADEGGAGGCSDSAKQLEAKDEKGGKLLSKPSAGSGWTKVSCPCCFSERVEPLVLVKLGGKVGPETKRWLIKVIGAPQKDGGEGSDISNSTECAYMYSLGIMINFKSLSHPGLKRFDVMTLSDVAGQKLSSAGVVVDTFPLHNRKKLKDLREAWYSGNQLAQPLDSVNDYFGSAVAFYFSFLDFYTWSLLTPAILGLAISYFSGEVKKEMVDSVSGSKVIINDDDSGPMISGHMLQAMFSMIWSTVFMELWKRRSSSLSYRWGTMNLAERFAEPRPNFYGDLGVNPVTGRVEPLFPEWKRDLRMVLVSVPVVGLFLGLVVLGMMCFYWGEAQVKQLHKDWNSLLSQALLYIPSVLHIVYTNMLGNVYRNVAQSLTEYENHREESAFENHLTAKILVFTFFNNFAVLFHIAFFKQDVPLLRKRLASLLIVSQLVNQVTEVVIPFLVDRFISAPHRTESEDDPKEDKFRNQRTLPVFPGLFAEYIELLVQFGYLSLFSCVYPLTAVLLLINNITEIRSDAYKICNLFRKPFSPPVANMGVWQVAFEVLSFVSVISNCWLLLLSPRLQELCREGGLSSTNVLLLAVFGEHVLILIKFIMAALIPDEPDWIRKKRDQMEYTSMQALKEQKLQPEVS